MKLDNNRTLQFVCLTFFVVLVNCYSEYVNVGISYNSGSYVSYFANTSLLYISAVNDVNSSDVYELYDTATNSMVYKGKNTQTIAVSGTKIQVGSLGLYTGPLILRPLTNSTTIYVRLGKTSTYWKQYRGSINISVSGSYFKLINSVDIEEYLYGVVPSEIGSWASTEAQKAQAVAARTFVKKNLSRHSSEGFNVCDTEHCQVYGGKSVESYQVRNAVNSTKGEVMTYSGSLIYTYYFSCCGGRTANSSDVWGSYYSYLVSVVDDTDEVYDTNESDDFCYNDSNYYWSYSISHTNLETKLKSSSYTRPTNSNSSLAENGISTTSVDTSGRIKYFLIQYVNPDEQKQVSGTNFRYAMGTSELKSTLLTSISYDPATKTYTFYGKGSGHGVGMCQAGADYMGRNGYNYKQILKHYYKGVTIDDVSPPVITHTPVTDALVNSSITITAYVTDSTGVGSVKVYYRSYGQSGFPYFINMFLTGNNYYTGIIPSNIVVPSGVEYYIEAKDVNGNTSYSGSSSQPYYITVVVTDTQGPNITHSPVTTLVEGTTVSISCSVTDASGVSNVLLYYKNSSMTSYTNLSMQKNGDNYTAVVLGKDVLIGELRYYIVAKDIYNNTSSYGTETNPVIVNITSSDTEGPVVNFTPPTEMDYNMPIEFVLSAEDKSGIKSIILYYKNDNETTYKQKEFVNISGNYYHAEVSKEDINISVSTPTLKYFIIATDNRNNSTVIPQNAPLETYKVIIILPKKEEPYPTTTQEQLVVFKSHTAKVVYVNKPSSVISSANFIVYDIKGKTVKKIDKTNGVKISGSTIEVNWDGVDDEKQKLLPGIYLYKLEVNNNVVKSGKILVIK
jgi:stage II sporulation protein D